MFVLLNAYNLSGGTLKANPSGGGSVSIGLFNGVAWTIKTPMFFYPGDIINTSASTATIHGYHHSKPDRGNAWIQTIHSALCLPVYACREQ